MRIYRLCEKRNNDEVGDLYDVFKETYDKNTGSSWGKEKFKSRSRGWIYFGDENGYIAVRPQRSGMYKLVSVIGNEREPMKKAKSLLKGLEELKREGRPTWGLVSLDIANMLERMGFKSIKHKNIEKAIRLIPPSVLGNVGIIGVNEDGGISLSYSDTGDTTKYLVGNDEYFKKLKQIIFVNPKLGLKEKYQILKIL